MTPLILLKFDHFINNPHNKLSWGQKLKFQLEFYQNTTLKRRLRKILFTYKHNTMKKKYKLYKKYQQITKKQKAMSKV